MFYFGNGIDRRTLYIILGVIVVISLATAGTAFWVKTLLTIPGIVIAIAFHEYAHAYTAYKFGDRTALGQGRLTLNPLAHLDPIGCVMLLFVGIGWGKPVQINPNNFTSNKSRQSCEMWISLAGPLTNFLLAIVFTFIYCLLYKYVFIYSTTMSIIMSMIMYTITINLGLGIFNLIPLPPLDGEKIFRSFLPYNAICWLDRNSSLLQLVFLILWITGVLGYIVSPVLTMLFNGLFSIVGMIVGI